jgi:tRNA pseudouridine38-40 synthase
VTWRDYGTVLNTSRTSWAPRATSVRYRDATMPRASAPDRSARRRGPAPQPRRAAAPPGGSGKARGGVTYRLEIEYDGTSFHGWQPQRSEERTVMGALQRALEAAEVKVLDLGGAGRTDAGVHALAQVAHLRLAQSVRPEPLRRALNAELPVGVHVLSLAPAPARFHARFDAVARTYLYQLSRRRTALGKRFVWWVRDELDLARLRTAADLVLGRHDFRQFCEAPAQQTSTIVVVDAVTIVEAGGLVLVRLTASHFLWKMVRRVVGALVRAASGGLELDELAVLISGASLPKGRGAPAEWTAPASGLFLERVHYPSDPPLAPPTPVVHVSPE